MRDRVLMRHREPPPHTQLNLSPANIRDPDWPRPLGLNAEMDKPRLIAAIQVSHSSPLAVSHALPRASRHSQSSCSSDVPLQGQIGLRLHTAHSLEIYMFSLEIYASRSSANSTKVPCPTTRAARLTRGFPHAMRLQAGARVLPCGYCAQKETPALWAGVSG